MDNLASETKNIDLYIHTTVQAYNVAQIPKFLDFLLHEKFKNVRCFPYFIWVRWPEFLCPNVLPQNFRKTIALKIEQRIECYTHSLLERNPAHRSWYQEAIHILRGFCNMLKNEPTHESNFKLFIKRTKQLDVLRNQSVIDALPELAPFFPLQERPLLV